MTIATPVSTESIPCLTGVSTTPLRQLEQKIIDNQCTIEAWFRNQWQETPAPFYASVDIRNAGFKLAPVDTNLFPAGFNNLNTEFLPVCVQAAQATLEKYHPNCQKILLIPENHTRNLFYLKSVATIADILHKAGFEIRIGSLLPDLKKPMTIALDEQATLTLEPIQRRQNRIHLVEFDPCLILLNNDLSEGIPEVLQGVSQTIVPPLALGWSTRTKSQHFQYYKGVSHDFAKLIDIDPWQVSPLFLTCNEVDFMTREGEDCLIHNVNKLYEQISEKYKVNQIEQQPFVVVKADAGTYGMGVMMINEPEEIKYLNRKERTRMSTTKGGRKVKNVIIQEGVYTFETYGKENAVTEPVVYMIGTHVVGGFFRVHKKRGTNENLNAPGMHFEPLAFCGPCNVPDKRDAPDCIYNRFYVYGVIARLALLASARELQKI